MDQKSELQALEQAAPEEQLIDLRDLLRALNQYKWGILGVAVATTIVAMLVALSLTPVYRATVTILIESKNNRPVQQVPDVYDPGTGTQAYYGTQYEILRSHDLAKRVVDKLDLYSLPEFAKTGGLTSLDGWRKWLPFLPSHDSATAAQDAEHEAQRKERVIEKFGDKLDVSPVLGSQLVKVSFDSQDPKLAAEVSNTLAEYFIESALEGKLSMAQKASSWLTEKLATVRDELQRSDQALQAFREKENLVNVGGDEGTRNLAEEALQDNIKRLRDASKTTAELESTYQQIQQAGDNPAKLEEVSDLLQDPIVKNTKSVMVDEAAQNLNQLEQRYGPKHPQIAAAKARLDAANAAYQKQLIATANGIKVKYEIARNIERQLSQYESSARGTIQDLDRKEYQLHALERDVDTNKQLYDMFLTRFKETDLTGNYEELSARVVDAAIPPVTRYKPEVRKIMLFAAIGGLFLGLLLAAVMSVLSDVVRSSEELETITGLSVLGVLPMVTEEGETRQLPALIVNQPKSGFSEGVRSIRTSVVLSDIDTKKKRLVVTSSVPAEGKTTISINLAIAHGQIERVLLLEGDLRRPVIAKQCGLPKDGPGLTEVLSGTASLGNSIYRYEAGNIDILPVGRVPPNPGEILASGRFHQLADLLASKYDRIIIDSAPCHAVSDTFLLARNCDGMIFLVRADVTSRRMIRRAISLLHQARVPLVGTIINQADLKKHGHFYGSYYYDYGYYA